jgi:hypothetical protein
MKMNYHRDLFILLLLALLQILVSCSTSRKTALACPKIQDARFESNARHGAGKKSSYHLLTYKNHEKRKPANIKSVTGIHDLSKDASSSVKDIKLKGNARSTDNIAGINIDKIEFAKGLTASIDNSALVINPHNFSSSFVSRKSKTSKVRFNYSGSPELCDTIVSTLGDINTSPTYSIRRINISAIKYANGTRDFFTGSAPVDYRYSTEERRIEGLGLAGVFASFAGLFVLGIPLGLLAVTFGCISLGRINRNPGRYKGKGYALVSIILGIVDIVGVIILLASAA